MNALCVTLCLAATAAAAELSELACTTATG